MGICKQKWKNEIKERLKSLKYGIIFLTLQTMKNELLLNGAFQRYEINMCSFSCSNFLMISERFYYIV